jgi:hypothetical protein
VAKDKDYYTKHPLIIKARELADTLKKSEEFNLDEEKKIELIIECNQIITNITGINYGATCKPKSSCCG